MTTRELVPSPSAPELLRRLGRALRKPGLPRSSVFTGARGVYAYSVHPDTPALLVREAEDGTRVTGVIKDGLFRPRKVRG